MKELLSAAVLAIALVLQSPSATSKCVTFTSNGRLQSGQPFIRALTGERQLRLTPDGQRGWHIYVVDPAHPTDDYMWLVSPPYQTAPQRFIGAGYGMTAAQSVPLERRLTFVLSRADYESMMAVHRARPAATELIAARRRLTLGSLRLKVTDFEVSGDALHWIKFEGEACVPR